MRSRDYLLSNDNRLIDRVVGKNVGLSDAVI